MSGAELAEGIALQSQPKSTERLLREQTTEDYRFIDGISLLGIIQSPLYVRQAIAA